MAKPLWKYYQKYHIGDDAFGSNKFYHMAFDWLKQCTAQPKIVNVGGKAYEMDLERWVKRFEKEVKRKINDIRKSRRSTSLKENNNQYYLTQPGMRTTPLWEDLEFLQAMYDIATNQERLWEDLEFLQAMYDIATNQERWQSNEDDTIRTLRKDSRWRCRKECDEQIVFLRLQGK